MKKFALTEQEIVDFRKNGFAGPFDLYEVDEAIQKYKKVRAKLFDRSNAIYDMSVDSVIAGYDRHFDVDELSEHIMRREIVDKVEGILGPNVICWRSEMFPKYPGDAGTDWHQADTFGGPSGGKPHIVWPMNSEFGGALTVWTALTDVTEENGCLRFIPGTHEEMFFDESKGMEYDPQTNAGEFRDGMDRAFFGYDYRNMQKDPNWLPNESDAVSMEMKAGQFVIFWSTLMHSSFPNSTTNKTRMATACRYLPSSVAVYPEVELLEEFGASVSLSKFGVIEVAGENLNEKNRVATKSATGFEFAKV